MTGEVVDVTGAAVPGVVVRLTNKANGSKFTAVTNGSGEYRFTNVPPGDGFEAAFVRPGFAAFDVKNIGLNVSTVRTQNATLTAGANEAVEVSAAHSEATINSADATIGNNIDVKALNDLQFTGTVAGFGSGSGGQFSLVTKSGTNNFHGNVNEYHRDTDLTANDYFSNLAGVPRSPLIQNQFGGNVGGPILKNKLFFFDLSDSRIVANSLQTRIPS